MINLNTDKFKLTFANLAETTEEFSKRSSVARTIVSKILNGTKTDVRPQTAGKLAKALGVKVEDLI